MTAVPTNTTVLNSNGPLTLYHSPTDILAMERPIPLTSTMDINSAVGGGIDMKSLSTVSHIHPIYGRLVTTATAGNNGLGDDTTSVLQQHIASGGILNNHSSTVSAYNPLTVKLVQENGGSIMTLPVTAGGAMTDLTINNGQRTALIAASLSGNGGPKSHLLPPTAVMSYAQHHPPVQQDGSTALSHDLGHLDLSQIVTLNQGVQQVRYLFLVFKSNNQIGALSYPTNVVCVINSLQSKCKHIINITDNLFIQTQMCRFYITFKNSL